MLNFLKPNRSTWKIFITISVIIFLALIISILNNDVNFIDLFLFTLTMFPLEFFNDLGLDVASGHLFLKPNFVGWFLIIISNVIFWFLTSLVISKLIVKFKKKIRKS